MTADMARPDIINTTLLWEYDLGTFDYARSYKIVIERVLQRDNLVQWREMIDIYNKEKIVGTIGWSAQLDERDKELSRIFLTSSFIDAA